MTITILFFGQLTDITGCNSMQLENPGTLSILKEKLFDSFPALKEAKFTIALNNQMVLNDPPIPENSTIALMPPFSGG